MYNLPSKQQVAILKTEGEVIRTIGVPLMQYFARKFNSWYFFLSVKTQNPSTMRISDICTIFAISILKTD